MNIANFLNKNVEQYPLNPALGFKKNEEWKQINWKQFASMVFKTANALKKIGISKEDKVAIFSDNSPEWIVVDLAIFSLGAISVPIYATNNLDQTEYVINNAEVKLMLVSEQAQYDIAQQIRKKSSFLKHILVAKKKVWIEKENSFYLEDFIEKESDSFEIEPRNDDDLATIIYTSGTTGTPKGVMLTHGNFTKVFQAHMDYFKFKNFEREHSLAFLPLSHVYERAWTLLSLNFGAKVSFLENPKLIANALLEVKPTMMCVVPRFYQKIYNGIHDMVEKGSSVKRKIFNWAVSIGGEVAELKRLGKEIPTLLKIKNTIANSLVFKKIKNKLGGNLWFTPCGGAAIDGKIARFFDAMGIHITVGYGLTESTATVSCYPELNYEYSSVGEPMGTQIKIGENNEVLVKGPGIMKGYYKNEEETKKVFTSDGWFKTGDAGRICEKGFLYITDRIKDMMKTSNGKYIVPQPIENLLSSNNLVGQVMVVAENRPYVTALVSPNFEALEQYAQKNKISYQSLKELVSKKEIENLYHSIIENLQKNLSVYEKVKKFTLMPSEFDIISGEITPTLKIKRNVVVQKYNELIEKMYAYS